MENKNRKYEVKGFEEYDCIEYIEERPSKYIHLAVTEKMSSDVKAYAEIIGETALGTATGIIVSEAVENNFRPFKQKLRPDQKIQWKELKKQLNCNLRESEANRLKKLADDAGITVTEYIRLAISYFFAHNQSFQ